MNLLITKDLLFDYFSGRASAVQKQYIDEWARQPENEEFFYKCLVDWELAHPQYMTDVPAAIDRYRDYVARQPAVQSQPLNTPNRRTFIFNRLNSWYIAASVSAILLVTWGFRSEIMNRTYATQPGQFRSWTLDDGSRVTLNANSTLKVPRFGLKWALFGQKNREVFLTGEAQFTVTHTKDNRRFIVKTPNALDVVVLGTEFTVYSRTNRMQVVLNQGKVALQSESSKPTEPIMLKPGDIVTLVDQKIQRKHVANPERFSAWKDELFVFEATPLSQVAQLLRDNYGLKVDIPDPALARETVSGSFKATNADELLTSLSKALDIQAIRRGKKVTFSARAN
ncbi:FecR family protein [Spirosoma panaciterrae]|uniref:FecR family protein n=1 Tax=Spirosoma panaciterrae TaxID=496058 RepID=UPI00036D3B46|nr:FecR domain-containing protein [Spirosoma panaciterrae]